MSPSDIVYHSDMVYNMKIILSRSPKSRSLYKNGQNMVPRHVPFHILIGNEIGFKLFADHLVRELAVEGLLFLYHFMQIKHRLLQYNIINKQDIGLLLPINNTILSKSTSDLISPALRPVAGNDFSVSFGAGNHTPQAEGCVDIFTTLSFANLTPFHYKPQKVDSNTTNLATLNHQNSSSKSITPTIVSNNNNNMTNAQQINLSPVHEEVDKNENKCAIQQALATHTKQKDNNLVIHKHDRFSIVVTPVDDTVDIKDKHDQDILDKAWKELSPFAIAVQVAKRTNPISKNKGIMFIYV